MQMTAGGPGVNISVVSHSSTEGFYFVNQSESGDFALTTQDTGETKNGSNTDNTGVMLRSATSGSEKADYYVYVVPNHRQHPPGRHLR